MNTIAKLSTTSVIFFITSYTETMKKVNFLKDECKYFGINGYSKLKKKELKEILVKTFENELERRVKKNKSEIVNKLDIYGENVALNNNMLIPSLIKKTTKSKRFWNRYDEIMMLKNNSILNEDCNSIVSNMLV